MPSIEMYLDVADLPIIQEFLNGEDEIVFVVPSEHGSYAAIKSIVLQPNAAYTIWHLPCGDIPQDCRSLDGSINTDPWTKWKVVQFVSN